MRCRPLVDGGENKPGDSLGAVAALVVFSATATQAPVASYSELGNPSARNRIGDQIYDAIMEREVLIRSDTDGCTHREENAEDTLENSRPSRGWRTGVHALEGCTMV